MTPSTVTERSGKSRVPLNAVLLSSSQFIRTAIGFVFFLYLARSLGPGDFGKYMFAFSLVEIFSILGDIGLHEYTIREMARRPAELTERLVGILGLKTILSSVSMVVLITIMPLLGKDRPTSLAVVAFAVAQVGYSWFYTTTIAYSVKQDLHIQAFLWLLEKALFAAAGVAALWAGRDFVVVALSNTFVQFFGGALSLWIAWRKYGPFRLKLDQKKWGAYLKAAFPFGLIVAFYLVYFRIDSVMISFFRGDEEVGLYGAAYNLVSALMFLPAGLMAALFPMLASTFHSPDDNLDGPFQRASRWLLAMSVPMAVGGWLLAEPLVARLLGEGYLPASRAVAILAWALPVWFITFLQGNILTVVERQKAVAAVGFGNMIVNLGLNLLIIPRYGFNGAALTTLLTELVGLSAMFWLLRRNISLVHTALTALRIGGLAAVMGVLVWLLRNRIPLPAVMALAAVTYGGTVVATGTIPASELLGVFRKRANPPEVIDTQQPTSL
ncbi:MAG: flippase [Thermoleophilia bacterium]